MSQENNHSTAILGISAYYHDSAAAVIIDGEIVAAAHEERFTRKKHDASFPLHAARYVLEEAGLPRENIWIFVERFLERAFRADVEHGVRPETGKPDVGQVPVLAAKQYVTRQ